MKYEHEFTLRAKINDDGTISLRLKDEGMIYAKNVRTGGGRITSEYPFEIGYSSEFEDDAKTLRKQRKSLKDLLQKKFGTIKTKIRV